MKCFWTANAEAGLGGVIILAGLFICSITLPGVRMGISLVLILLALLGIAFPVYLIGMCGNDAMPCRMGTLPAFYILSTLLFAVSIINVFYLRAKIKKGINACTY